MATYSLGYEFVYFTQGHWRHWQFRQHFSHTGFHPHLPQQCYEIAQRYIWMLALLKTADGGITDT